MGLLQKTALLGTARIVRKRCLKVEEKGMTLRTFGHWQLMARSFGVIWCNVGIITSARAKALLYNNYYIIIIIIIIIINNNNNI